MFKKIASNLGKLVGLFAIGATAAHAAVDAAVTDAIAAAGTDATTVVNAFLLASILIVGVTWVWSMVKRGGGK